MLFGVCITYLLFGGVGKKGVVGKRKYPGWNGKRRMKKRRKKKKNKRKDDEEEKIRERWEEKERKRKRNLKKMLKFCKRPQTINFLKMTR